MAAIIHERITKVVILPLYCPPWLVIASPTAIAYAKQEEGEAEMRDNKQIEKMRDQRESFSNRYKKENVNVAGLFDW